MWMPLSPRPIIYTTVPEAEAARFNTLQIFPARRLKVVPIIGGFQIITEVK